MNEIEDRAIKIAALLQAGFSKRQAEHLYEFSQSKGIVFIIGYDDDGNFIHDQPAKALCNEAEYGEILFGSFNRYDTLKLFNFDLEFFAKMMNEYGIEPIGSCN